MYNECHLLCQKVGDSSSSSNSSTNDMLFRRLSCGESKQ